ncbi:hypothetical protein IF2G_10836 [Cordyceps javanica]|nr:hypothetical protein IF2G_10836 [Cordyceps javanica]
MASPGPRPPEKEMLEEGERRQALLTVLKTVLENTLNPKQISIQWLCLDNMSKLSSLVSDTAGSMMKVDWRRTRAGTNTFQQLSHRSTIYFPIAGVILTLNLWLLGVHRFSWLPSCLRFLM